MHKIYEELNAIKKERDEKLLKEREEYVKSYDLTLLLKDAEEGRSWHITPRIDFGIIEVFQRHGFICKMFNEGEIGIKLTSL